MSECKYEFRQPVGVCYGGQWFQGVAIKPTDYDGFTWCRFWNGEEAYFNEVRFPLDRIRPDPDFALVSTHTAPPEPKPKGWRLPKKGDVVRVDGIDHDVTLCNVSLGMFASCEEDGCSINGAEPRMMTVVRLHDEPEPPQPIGTLDACRDRVELLNQGLDLVIAVLNNGDAPPALRDAAVLAVQAAKLKLGGES